MSISGIQGQLLEVTVVGCLKLKDTEWISRQDPYVCLDYGGTKVRTRTCTDGGKNPVFQEKFMFTLIEGLRDLKVSVWNSNSLSTDDFIGSGTIHLQKVLSQGYEDCTWTLQTKTGRYGGEVRLIMHFSGGKKPQKPSISSAAPYASTPQMPLYTTPPPAAGGSYPPSAPFAVTPHYPAYPPSEYPPHAPPPSAYPPLAAYPPPPSAYPPPPMAYPSPPCTYPPTQLSSAYPPNPYPPPPAPLPYYSTGAPPALYPPPY